MIPLALPSDRPVRLVALGAHADDIEIGAAGLVMGLAATASLEVTWIVASATGARADEARASAARLLDGVESCSVHVWDARERYLPYDPAVKERFDELGRDPVPDIVLAPRLEDRHQDHATIAGLAWQTFRRSLILEYEIAKYEGDLGTPNLYLPLAREAAEAKVAHLMAAFPSQAGRDWYTEDTFWALLRLRGVESGAAQGFAEAFTARKVVLDAPGSARHPRHRC